MEGIGRAVSRDLGVEGEGLYRPREIPLARSILMELCRVQLSRGMSLAETGRRDQCFGHQPESEAFGGLFAEGIPFVRDLSRAGIIIQSIVQV